MHSAGSESRFTKLKHKRHEHDTKARHTAWERKPRGIYDEKAPVAGGLRSCALHDCG